MDGEINLLVEGGTGPYLFNWSNGSFNQDQQNLGAGVYTVVVTDVNAQTDSATIILYQPNVLQVTLEPVVYDGGYHITAAGYNDGVIVAHVEGGTADYLYLWSNSETQYKAGGLSAGNYSVTVTDMNACTASASVVLTQPTPLQIVGITSPMHNGYNVSCKRGDDGAINLVVAGGVQSEPYKFHWSTGRETQNLSAIPAGNYSVRVTDAAGASIATQITLTEPPLFKISGMVPSLYPNGQNLSCNTCSNGSITVNTTGGVGTPTYLWESGQTTQTISNQQAGTYFVTVTDLNGCTASSSKNLVAPERDDWSMFGNANIDSSNFIGTSSNNDFTIKTNNIERLKFHKSGSISMPSTSYFDKLYVNKIVSSDSIIHFGLNSMSVNTNQYKIFSDATIGIGIGGSNPSWLLDFGTAVAIGKNSLSLGNYLWTDSNAENAITIGSGFPDLNFNHFLHNPNPNTLYLGFNSDIPTLVVTPAPGLGTSGNVGIGPGILNPTERLEVNGNIKVTSLAGTGNRIVLADQDGRLIPSMSGSNSTGWSTTGNSQTNSNQDFIGTSDYQDLVLKTNNTEILRMTVNEKATIFNAPNSLQLSTTTIGPITSSANNFYSTGYIGFNARRYNTGTSSYWQFESNSYDNGASGIITAVNGDLRFFSVPSQSSAGAPTQWVGDEDLIRYHTSMIIRNDGKIGIGVSPNCQFPDDYNLYVTHGIRTEKIKVDVPSDHDWADYVFHKNYKLLSLSKLESFIDKNGHLPNIATGAEVKRDGIDLAEMQVKLLEKIEELTLYIIELNKEVEKLKSTKN